MELLHLRAGAMRAVFTDWLRKPLQARSFRDILGSLFINIVNLICVNEKESEMLCSLNVWGNAESGWRRRLTSLRGQPNRRGENRSFTG